MLLTLPTCPLIFILTALQYVYLLDCTLHSVLLHFDNSVFKRIWMNEMNNCYDADRIVCCCEKLHLPVMFEIFESFATCALFVHSSNAQFTDRMCSWVAVSVHNNCWLFVFVRVFDEDLSVSVDFVTGNLLINFENSINRLLVCLLVFKLVSFLL